MSTAIIATEVLLRGKYKLFSFSPERIISYPEIMEAMKPEGCTPGDIHNLKDFWAKNPENSEGKELEVIAPTGAIPATHHHNCWVAPALIRSVGFCLPESNPDQIQEVLCGKFDPHDDSAPMCYNCFGKGTYFLGAMT